MFSCPRRLHVFVIEKNLMGLMTELPEIAGISSSTRKKALRPSLHLFVIGCVCKAGILGIKPMQERRIISINDEKAHTRLASSHTAEAASRTARLTTSK